MARIAIIVTLTLAAPGFLKAEETFVTIQRVSGNRMAIVKDSSGGGGRGMRGSAGGQTGSPKGGASAKGGGAGRRGRRGGSTAASQPVIITIPSTTKITSASRERRTFEFRVGAELAGGIRNRIFQNMKQPLSARIITAGNRITEVNVITQETDINQSNTTSSGQTVIAIRPKRPPMKKK